MQLHLACQNKQKSQRWPPSIFYGFRDTNPRRWRRLTFTKNTNMNGNLFLLCFPFSNITLVEFLKIQHYIFIILFFGEFWKFLMEIIRRFKCLMVEFKCFVSWVIALYTSAQLNKWNLQLGFLDFRIIFLGKYFLGFFSRSFRSKSPIFLFGDQKEF